MEEKKNFFEVFRPVDGGKLSPQFALNINGVIIGPGVSFGPGTKIGGVDFYKIFGRELAIEKQNGIYIYILKGYYGQHVDM